MYIFLCLYCKYDDIIACYKCIFHLFLFYNVFHFTAYVYQNQKCFIDSRGEMGTVPPSQMEMSTVERF